MSGKPSPEQTAELRRILKRKYELEKEYEVLIEQRDKANKRIKELNEIFEKQSAVIIKALADMDVHSKGNYGWENRTLWFLTELVGENAVPAKNKMRSCQKCNEEFIYNDESADGGFCLKCKK